ncbi:MAG TPA: hypothetical protein VN759_06305, partial [Pseudolysinimonas sp.]|nr:hypothetical protein [Pseudolysinimonas sp.]
TTFIGARLSEGGVSGRQDRLATDAARQAWLCRSEGCRFPLGMVVDGVLRPFVVPEAIDERGVAKIRCPRSPADNRA